VINAVVSAAPKSEHRDLYGKADGDWLPRWSTLLGGSGLGDATRLAAQGATVPVEAVADSFVAYCTAPAPAVEDWLLLSLLAGAPFVHASDPSRTSDRSGAPWFDFTGPRPEARHWRALLSLILWSEDLLHVDAVFDVERGRSFDLNRKQVPTTIQIYEDRYGSPEEVEVREIGSFYVAPAGLPRLQAFSSAVTAKIDAVMDGITSGRSLPRKRARHLERAARHLLQVYQRTYRDDGVWEQEADELYLDYVIALEALMVSPDDKHEGISERIRTRPAALFPSPLRERVEKRVQKAYSARSKYVHGGLLVDQEETQKQAELRELRLLVRQVALRWLILTPCDTQTSHLRLDAAADCSSCAPTIDEPLRAFFQESPPQGDIRA
jgi:hypothetical protein